MPFPARQQCDHAPENDLNKRIMPLILTFSSINRRVKKIFSTNFELLRSDPETTKIFDSLRVLGAFLRDTNLKVSLVRNTLQSGVNTEDDSFGTFPCRRPRCKTCAHTMNPAVQFNTPGGPLTVRHRFTCTTRNVVYIYLLLVVHVLCLTLAKLDTD